MSGRPGYLQSPKAAELQTQAPASPCQREPQRPKSNLGHKSTSPKWVSWRSTNRSQSPSWPKMATMRISQKRERWEKSGVATVKVASGPQTFPLRSHEGPSWAKDEFLEKYGFPLGIKMLHFPTGKWVPGRHKTF